ncbi:MAG: hypothetical protein KGL39_57430 [Patescibacteria group bacterium]|nr:hypothetical protein [Patescibacteria group bacterium]
MNTDKELVEQNGLDLIREAVTEQWGERCPEFNPECWCCKAWAEVDRIEALAAKLEKATEALKEIGRFPNPPTVSYKHAREALEAINAS